MKRKPTIAISLGDPAGIGPEVVIKALSDKCLLSKGRFVLVGRADSISDLSKDTPFSITQTVSEESITSHESAGVLFLDAGIEPGAVIRRGIPSADSGKVAAESVLRAIDLARNDVVEAICTAPISKEAMGKAGYPWAGHTEMICEKSGASRAVMMMKGGPIRVTMVTTHIALEEVPSAITIDDVLQTIRITDESIKTYFGTTEPLIGVCAMNPHSGEGGMFGLQESEVIIPAIEAAKQAGINCRGPIPADTAFHRAAQGEFDAVVAMYHDQGLIPVKLIAFDTTVNITLGCPILRTSPGHGTAFDIAGKGKADPTPMKEAILTALEMCEKKRAVR